MKIPNQVRYFNKRYLNKVMLLCAGKPRSEIALLTHRGRVSGKQYDMPIMTAPCPGGFVFALTYGLEVDWLKNLNAAGWGRLKWHGVDFELSEPVQFSMAEGQRSFSGFKGKILRLFTIQDYIQLTAEVVKEGFETVLENRTLAP